MLRIMRPLYAATVLLLAAAATQAAPPEAPKELKVKPGQMVRIVVKTDAELGQARNFTDEEAFFGELVSPKGSRHFVFQAPAEGAKSQYAISWWSKGEVEGSFTTIFVDSGVAPIPPPKPVPPKPVPDPDVKKVSQVTIVIVEESMKRTQEQGKTLFDKSFRDWAKAGGHKIQLVDKDDPAVARANLTPYVTQVGLPAVLVFDQGAFGPQVPLSKFKLPDTGSALQAEVAKVVKP